MLEAILGRSPRQVRRYKAEPALLPERDVIALGACWRLDPLPWLQRVHGRHVGSIILRYTVERDRANRKNRAAAQ